MPPSHSASAAPDIPVAGIPASGILAPGRLEPDSENLVRIAASCVIAASVATALYLARPVLLPFALATLFAFALAPIVSALQRRRLARGPAVVCTVVLAVAIVASLALFIGTELSRLAPGVPRYQATLLAKIQSIRNSAARSDLIKSATGMFDRFDRAIANDSQAPDSRPDVSNTPRAALAPGPNLAPGQAGSDRPVLVTIRPPDPGPFRILETVADPILLPLANGALVVIFVIFILLQKEDLRDRFISLAGARDLQRTTAALDEGARRLSRYLLLQFAVNACFGVWIAGGLWLIGLPSPALWGLIAAILRFIPYVGVPVAAVLPLTLGLALDPGWTRVVLTAVLFFGSEAVAGQAIEPWLYGRQMGLSPIAVVLCAVFWTWIWGPVGLLLSTPLTMCMAILGRNVEHLKFLDILLGDRAALLPEEAFYLSMLGGKTDEEAARAETFLKDAALRDYLDAVAVKGLALAHLDESRGKLDAMGAAKIHAAVRRLLDDIADGAGAASSDPARTGSAAQRSDSFASGDVVLCVAGRGELDSAAATLLEAVLHGEGISARTMAAETMPSLRPDAPDAADARIVCLSYLAPCQHKNARYLVRRIRRQLPHALVLAGFWNEDHDDTAFLDALESIACDAIATSLADAAAQIAGLLKARAARALSCSPG